MAERTVLITGANSGIGLATALEVARRGFRSVGSVRSDAKAEIVQKAAADAGVEVETVLLDVTDADQCAQVMGRLELHGLVNNAGYGVMGAIEDVDDDEARVLLETMVIAPMRLAKLALPRMREAGEGRIVNISSIAGRTSTAFAGWYTAAKHALEAASDALRMEVAGAGVKVVLVEPGGFKTNIWEDTQRDFEKRQGSRFDAAYKRSLRATELTQVIMGHPDTCAKVVATALSTRLPRSRYLVGLDAQSMNLASTFTPTFIKDRVIRLGLGI